MIRIDHYESSEDEDYEPTNLEEQEFKHQHQKAKKTGLGDHKSADELWRELQQEQMQKTSLKKVKLQNTDNTLDLASRILSSKEIRSEKKVMFAGKQFIMDEISGELREIDKPAIVIEKRSENQQQFTERDMLQNKYKYLNHVVAMLRSRYRNINSIHKSKMDWKSFVKKQGIEDKLNYNRKGGALEDYKFMKKVDQRN